jgi:putative aldouronate transport system permease protein
MNGKLKKERIGFIGKVTKSFKNDWQLYVLAMPAMVYVLIFSYAPMYGLQIAFKDFTPSKGFANSAWIGFKHFKTLFSSYQFWPMMKNTIGISMYSLLIGFLPPIILAILLHNTTNKKFKGVVQTVTYAPHFISVVVMVSIMRLILSPKSGVVNTIIAILGGSKIDFMGNPDVFSHLYVLSNIWQSIGWSSIIYMAALSGANPELYEAAKVDGANKFQRIINVEIPCIAPTAIIMLIMACGQIMNASDQKVLLMQNPLNLSKSEIIGTYVFKSGLLNQQYGYSAAAGLFQSIINVIMLVVVNKISRKLSESSLW